MGAYSEIGDAETVGAAIGIALETLRGGGVVAIPTDTLYGLAADALSADAVERVYQIKGRPADLPLPVLAAGWEQAGQVADLSNPAIDALAGRLAARFWPGALTLVLPAVSGLPPRLTAGRDSIAVRMPDHAVPLALCRGLGRPITGTSANASGAPNIVDAAELRECLGGLVDGMITVGTLPQGASSTIVAVGATGLRLLREGVLPYAEIERAAGLP